MTKLMPNFQLDFPMLHSQDVSQPLIYLDNAATSFKPRCVIEAVKSYYESECATVHRSIYDLSVKMNEKYQSARKSVQHFINTNSQKEVVFTSGTTMSLNLLAHSLGDLLITQDDEILVTEIEHHSNLVPWQMLAKRKKAHLKFIPVKESGDIDLVALKKLLTPKTKIVSFPYISNALGVVNPVQEITSLIKQNSSAVVVLDGAQVVSHQKVDVQKLGVDFFVFSAHKMYGPTGVGILYGKEALLEKMPPFFGGGDMIEKVSLHESTYNELPFKFEAGTPNIAGVLGLKAAIDYLEEIGFDLIYKHEEELKEYAIKKLEKIADVQILANPIKRSGLISFVVKDLHALDITTLLNLKGIALRSGHLCAQTALKRFRIDSFLRISFAIYNSFEDIDKLIVSLEEAIAKLKL